MWQIKTNHLTYVYDKKDPNHYDALSDVSLEIKKGDLVCIVGKTGSGKSTLVQTFNNLISPTSGYCQVENFYITSDKKLKKELLKNQDKSVIEENKHVARLRRKVGLVFQFPEYQLFAETIIKDVMFGPKNFGLKEEEAKEVAKKSLIEVGIPESYFEKSPFELSGGEKRRVAIAGIIASDPDILVLDEPTLNFAKTVIVLNDGKLIEVTSPEKLFQSPDIEKYSLEIPTLFKFINLLKNGGFAGNLSEIYDFDTLIERIYEAKYE